MARSQVICNGRGEAAALFVSRIAVDAVRQEVNSRQESDMVLGRFMRLMDMAPSMDALRILRHMGK